MSQYALPHKHINLTLNKIIITVLLCMTQGLAHAQISNQVIDLSENHEHDDTISQKIQTYYKNPNPKHALNLSLELMQQPIFENKTHARLNTWLWSAQVLQQHSAWQTRKWCQSLKKAQTPANIAPIFHFANTNAAKRCLKSLPLTENERHELTQLPDLSHPLQRDVLAPTDLDMLWTTFFATGNPKVLHKLIDFISNNQSNQNQNIQLTYIAAVWSLNANIKQDMEIKKLINDYVNTLPPKQQEGLKRSLNLTS